MNFNSKILKIFIVLALIFIIIPTVAAEDADDSALTEDQSIDESYVVQSQDDISDEVLSDDDSSDSDDSAYDSEDTDDADDIDDTDDDTETEDTDDDTETEDTDGVDVAYDEESSADLEIVSFATPSKVKVGDYVIFTFLVTNNGPDTAYNAVAYANILQGDVLFISYLADKGTYDSYTGIWDIGDLEYGETATLLVLGKVLSDTPIITVCSVSSDTPDPDEDNNYYVDLIPVEKAYSAATSTLPATGNPIIMVLLALLTMVGVTLTKKE